MAANRNTVVFGQGTRREQYHRSGEEVERAGVALTGKSQTMRSPLNDIDVTPEGRARGQGPGRRTQAARPQNRNQDITARVFGGGDRARPREAAVVLAVDANEAAGRVASANPLYALSGQYYTVPNGVQGPYTQFQPGDQLPADVLRPGAGGAKVAPRFRSNRHTGETVQMSAPVVRLDGEFDQRTRTQLEQFAPPDGRHSGELQNNVQVRTALSSRYAHPLWAAAEKHFHVRAHEDLPAVNLPGGPKAAELRVRVVPRLASGVDPQVGNPKPARSFEQRTQRAV